MLSQTAAYALRAVIHLARQQGDDPVRVEDVAEALDVPRNYLSKILHVLAREGVLDSTRGPGGGFRLARPADGLLLRDVVGEFDPTHEGGPCLLVGGECDDDAPCAAHGLWKEVSAGVTRFFGETTVADLAASPSSTSHQDPLP